MPKTTKFKFLPEDGYAEQRAALGEIAYQLKRIADKLENN